MLATSGGKTIVKASGSRGGSTRPASRGGCASRSRGRRRSSTSMESAFRGSRCACLVTGAAGFIGSHVAERALADGHDVVLLDAFTDYYDRASKAANVADAAGPPERDVPRAGPANRRPGARARRRRVRSSTSRPMPGLPRSWTDMETYTACNLIATYRLVEAARAAGVRRFIQISTSSVYGTEAVRRRDAAAPARLAVRRDQARGRAARPRVRARPTASRPRSCATSRSTGRGSGRTWRITSSSRRCSTGRT